MCLGIPGEVVQWIDRDPIFALAEVEFDGVRQKVHMACVPTVEVGDFVIVHAGLAICQVDAAEAERLAVELARLESLEMEHDDRDLTDA